MPFYTIGKHRIVFAEYELSKYYWPLLMKMYIEKFGPEECLNPSEVKQRLIFNFENLCGLFSDEVAKLKSASFFMFCYLNNEAFTLLYLDQLQGFKPDHKVLTVTDIALERRVNKIILEQFVKFPLTHHDYIENEIVNNKIEYTQRLEKLLYLGSQIYVQFDLIAQTTLFPRSISIPKIVDHENFTIQYDAKFKEVFDYSQSDIYRHQFKTEIVNRVEEVVSVLSSAIDIDYGNVMGALFNDTPVGDLSYGLWQESLQKISKTFNVSEEKLLDLYSGFLLDSSNALSVQDSFLRSQNNNRFTYRPILKLNINGKETFKTSKNKYFESMSMLTAFAIPYNSYPDEWKKYEAINDYVAQAQSTNDKVLEVPVCKLIEAKGHYFDSGITSVMTNNKASNINIVSKGPGEIDVAFTIMVDGKVELYICECKNNRFRPELHNQCRDYSNFLEKYEKQLTRKVKWANENPDLLLTHLERKYNLAEGELTKLICEVKGIFIINSGTIYMHDGLFEVYSMTSFEEFINEAFVRIEFELQEEGSDKVTVVKYPYFRNLGFTDLSGQSV